MCGAACQLASLGWLLLLFQGGSIYRWAGGIRGKDIETGN